MLSRVFVVWKKYPIFYLFFILVFIRPTGLSFALRRLKLPFSLGIIPWDTILCLCWTYCGFVWESSNTFTSLPLTFKWHFGKHKSAWNAGENFFNELRCHRLPSLQSRGTWSPLTMHASWRLLYCIRQYRFLSIKIQFYQVSFSPNAIYIQHDPQ